MLSGHCAGGRCVYAVWIPVRMWACFCCVDTVLKVGVFVICGYCSGRGCVCVVMIIDRN